MPLTSNEEVTLYPVMPDPTNEGAVHMYTEQRLLAENLKVIVHLRLPQKVTNAFRRRFRQLIPSRWQRSWSVNIVHSVRPSLQTRLAEAAFTCKANPDLCLTL